MPSYYGAGFAHVGEGHYLRGPRAAWWTALPPVQLVLYLHGATGTTVTVTDGPDEMRLINLLAKKYAVLVSDWGGDTYGNDTGIARVEEGRVNALAALNIDPAASVGIVAMSMGSGLGMAYTLANPTKVGFHVGMIPAMDINDAVVNNRGGLASAINAAYPGGAYDDTRDGPTHSPVRFAGALPSGLPIHLFTSSNDPTIVPATTNAFLAARPQTKRTDLGAVGHSAASITSQVPQIAETAIALGAK